MRSPREAERRHCRPEDELTGRHSSVRYSGAAPTIQWRTMRAILNRMRFSIGSQWSSLCMAAETLSNLGTPEDQSRSRVQDGLKSVEKMSIRPIENTVTMVDSACDEGIRFHFDRNLCAVCCPLTARKWKGSHSWNFVIIIFLTRTTLKWVFWSRYLCFLRQSVQKSMKYRCIATPCSWIIVSHMYILTD